MKFTEPIIIGLEIHAELNTNTKLFCSCPTQGSEKPNTRICEICLGMPGSKPKVNKKAIEAGIKIAHSLGCKISADVLFSRKSYFYPDMAKNYQITQYEIPVGENGSISVNGKKISINRVHLEEDPAALIHPAGIENSEYVLIDYNRSGNPLCEIVTEPELHSPTDARDFLKALITILRYLGVFDPEKNIIKADANVSVRETGYVRQEIKNITGFKEIEKALSYEIVRQREEAAQKIRQVQQTRSWDASAGITSMLRTKESEEDYGYIIDPDLVPIQVTAKLLQSLKKEIPELPAEKAKRYIKEYKIAKEDATVLTEEYDLAMIFEKAVKKVNPLLAAKWVRRELVRVINYNKIELSEMKINQDQFIVLLQLLDKNEITEKIGQRIIEKLAVEDIDVRKYIDEKSLGGVAASSDIEKFCSEALSENPDAVADYKSGKMPALNFLLGAVMKKSRGKADPKEVRILLVKMLK